MSQSEHVRVFVTAPRGAHPVSMLATLSVSRSLRSHCHGHPLHLRPSVPSSGRPSFHSSDGLKVVVRSERHSDYLRHRERHRDFDRVHDRAHRHRLRPGSRGPRRVLVSQQLIVRAHAISICPARVLDAHLWHVKRLRRMDADGLVLSFALPHLTCESCAQVNLLAPWPWPASVARGQ